MSLTLEIVSGNTRDLGAKVSKTFGQDGGTIGRAIDADWALPDRNRYLSGKHASIDFRSGTYYIVDTSKNGVFVNGADEPVGKGKPQRLFSGDLIRIGDYEIRVSIENVDDTRESLLSTSHIDPVDLKQRVESPEPTGYELLEAHVITGVGIEMHLEDEDDEDDEKAGPGGGSALERSLDPPASEAIEEPASLAAPAAHHADVPSIVERRAVPQAPINEFFKGAGIDPPTLAPQQAARLMRNLGELTRELVAGTIECLQVRSLQKAELKQANTVIQPLKNNPLKFSANVEEGVTRLLLDESEAYMVGADAVRAAFADLSSHQKALMQAMRQALDEYLERLDPEAIERGARSGRIGALMSAANRHRYWDVYKDVYGDLGDRVADEFPQAFLEELAKAYERALGRGAPASGSAEGLKAG